MAANKMFDVAGKHAIVTGGARGIGRGIAEIYLENGCKVVLMDKNKEQLEQTVGELCAKGYDAYAVAGDLSELTEMDRMFAEAMKLLDGVLDVLCPCAGLQYRSAPEDFPVEKFIEIQRVNVLQLFRLSQLAIQVMLKQEGRERGKIILMGSLGAYTAGHNIVAYNTSKGAVAMMTRSLAESCASRNISVNCICPGYVATEILSTMDPERKAAIASKIPAGRIGTIDDMKGPALFLASSASDWMNGALVLVDGGQGAIH